MSSLGSMAILDHRNVEWANVRRTSCLIHQHFHYDYPGPIRNLRHRLVIVPPPRHGGQRLISHDIVIAPRVGNIRQEWDTFGNLIVVIDVERIERAIDFLAHIAVEGDVREGPVGVSASTYQDPALRMPSRLTIPDKALSAAATGLRAKGGSGVALARDINSWVHQEMAYGDGATSVRSTAADAFALRRGVCQDFAHVMLTLCRFCGLPARYVSGHLLGEGGTHAWVEVLLPDDAAPDRYIAHPFDPTHGTEPGLNYITIAVGRDYADVAPTSGTFCAPYAGKLTGEKRAALTEIEYFAGGDARER